MHLDPLIRSPYILCFPNITSGAGVLSSSEHDICRRPTLLVDAVRRDKFVGVCSPVIHVWRWSKDLCLNVTTMQQVVVNPASPPTAVINACVPCAIIIYVLSYAFGLIFSS